MRYVIAFVQPFVAAKVADALHDVQGVTGATFTEARGFGRGRRDGVASIPDAEAIHGTAPRVRIEVMVREGLEDRVVEAIRQAAHTGNRGDGKIFVIELERAVRISTGEEAWSGASESKQTVV